MTLTTLASSPLARYQHGDVKNFRQASGLDAAIARGQHAAMGDVSDLTEDDGTSSPTILHQADAIRFLERARARR